MLPIGGPHGSICPSFAVCPASHPCSPWILLDLIDVSSLWNCVWYGGRSTYYSRATPSIDPSEWFITHNTPHGFSPWVFIVDALINLIRLIPIITFQSEWFYPIDPCIDIVWSIYLSISADQFHLINSIWPVPSSIRDCSVNDPCPPMDVPYGCLSPTLCRLHIGPSNWIYILPSWSLFIQLIRIIPWNWFYPIISVSSGWFQSITHIDSSNQSRLIDIIQPFLSIDSIWSHSWSQGINLLLAINPSINLIQLIHPSISSNQSGPIESPITRE